MLFGFSGGMHKRNWMSPVEVNGSFTVLHMFDHLVLSSWIN